MAWPRFSLKTLFWLTTVAAAFLGGVCAGAKLDSLRHDFELGPPVYLNDDGTPALPGVRTNHIQHKMRPKYPLLEYLPGAPSGVVSEPETKSRWVSRQRAKASDALE